MTKDFILHGDVYACLDYLNDNSISVAITSPPYWKQRDYGFEGQIGQEKNAEGYIGKSVAIYNKLREKLKDDGLFFLNVGDKYLNRYGKSHLLQIPYRLAFHMVKDGWKLMDIIIWYKPNHMPSSVKDRFSNTFEPILVFAKNDNNIYNKGPTSISIPLQPTPWKHTAAYPEKLVEEMLNRADLKDGDLVLDPFAGTGTTAVVVGNIRRSLTPKKISSIMIEKGDRFIDIIRERANIKKVTNVTEKDYSWEPVNEEELTNIKPQAINEDRHGEVYLAKDSQEFLSALKGINTDNFKDFHRKDALYFFGVKNWHLDDLYYISQIFEHGYVLRNMIIASHQQEWYPIFMFASSNTKVAYKFYIDRVRIKPKTDTERIWEREEFIEAKVRDISGKKSKDGNIVEIISYYKDDFPKTVAVQWDGHASVEYVLHPGDDEFLMESIAFHCPNCDTKLEESYDPISENKCPKCSKILYSNKESLPIMKEPDEVLDSIKELETDDDLVGKEVEIKELEKVTSSKFADLDRINWGASPGARKVMLGEYFTKMRLYRIDQPTIAQYLTVLRESKNIKISQIVNEMPEGYTHTVGHWFRKDFGGSIPIPEDVERLKEILGIENNILKVLERTALKFQTVKSSIKGRNPGDFIEISDDEKLKRILKLAYMPSTEYLKSIDEFKEFNWTKPQ